MDIWTFLKKGAPFSEYRKGGVECKGGSLHDGLVVLTVSAVLESTCPPFACPTKYKTFDGFDGFGGFGG